MTGESRDFEPRQRITTLIDVANEAFWAASEGRNGFEHDTYQDRFGMAHEKVSYMKPYGADGQETSIVIFRPTLDTGDLQKEAEGTIDELPQAIISVSAPRSFLFDLTNGEKYHTFGYFRVMQLSSGPYLDISMAEFRHDYDEVTGAVLQSHAFPVGSLLRPLPTHTDWAIQDVIDPNQS